MQKVTGNEDREAWDSYRAQSHWDAEDEEFNNYYTPLHFILNLN